MFDRSYVISHRGHPHFIPDDRILSLRAKASYQPDEKIAEIIKNLSDLTKLKIYLLLSRVEEIPVSDIKVILGLSQPTISHALRDLKNAGIVESSRCGKLVCYSLNKISGVSPAAIKKLFGL